MKLVGSSPMSCSALSVPLTEQITFPVPSLGPAQLGTPAILPPRVWYPVLKFVAGLKRFASSLLSVPLTPQVACPVALVAQLGIVAMIPPRVWYPVLKFVAGLNRMA